MLKNIVSFTLFGSAEIYLKGAIENARLAPVYYPGWECKFYVEQAVPDEIKNQLLAHGATVVNREKNGAYIGLFWRFEPWKDPDVNVWISRDVDSRLCERESFAVKEWLETDKSFHVMRDGHNHDLYPIMAGMFGVRNDIAKVKYPNINFECPGHLVNLKDADQLALRNIWDIVKEDSVCHDHWAHNQPISSKLSVGGGRDPNTTYQGQGVFGHVTNRKNNYPDQFSNNSINKPFPLHSKMEFGLYLGQRITEDNTPIWNEEVQWEYELRGEKW